MLATVAWIRLDTTDWSMTDESFEVDSIEQLDALLDSVSFPAEAPVIAIVRRKNGDTFAIGVGKPVLYPEDEDDSDLPDITVANIAPANGGPPSYTSHTDSPYPGDICFFYNGSDSEFGGEAAVPRQKAREALRQFLTSEGLPTAIDWQED